MMMDRPKCTVVLFIGVTCLAASSCGRKETRPSIPGVVRIDDEAITVDPVFMEIAARGGTLYVRESTVSITFSRMMPPSIEGEELTVVDSTGGCPEAFQDADVALLCLVGHLTYLDLWNIQISESQLGRIRKCHPICRIVQAGDSVQRRGTGKKEGHNHNR